jgi:hypothetical protein
MAILVEKMTLAAENLTQRRKAAKWITTIYTKDRKKFIEENEEGRRGRM